MQTQIVKDNLTESEEYWKGRHDGIRIATRCLGKIVHEDFIARLLEKDLYAIWQCACQDGEQRNFDEWLLDHGNPV